MPAETLRASWSSYSIRMKRFALVALIAMCLMIVGCTESEPAPETSVTEVSSSTSMAQTIPPTTTTTVVSPTLTFREQEEPPEFTAFTSSTACDPSAEDANLQVVQAFVTAYNDRDEARLAELVSADSVVIADMSGIPHLAEDDWTVLGAWADKGWSVDDRFKLTRLVMFDSGSVFDLERSNDVLRANGIERLHHSVKVHSFRCSITRLVLYLPTSEDPTSSECLFWEVFADSLAEGTTQSIVRPEACSG